MIFFCIVIVEVLRRIEQNIIHTYFIGIPKYPIYVRLQFFDAIFFLTFGNKIGNASEGKGNLVKVHLAANY